LGFDASKGSSLAIPFAEINRFAFFLPLCLLIFWSHHLLAAPVATTTDGGFALNAPDQLSKLLFSRTLSKFEKRFYTLTGYQPSSLLPILVVLHDVRTDQLSEPQLSLDVMEGDIVRIQVDLPETRILTPEDSRILVRALLLRQYYEGKTPPPGSNILEFPFWLLHGLGRACNPDANFANVPNSFLQGGTPPTVADLLVQKEPDDSQQSVLAVYDAMSAALLNAGLQGKGGGESFQKWVGHFEVHSSPQKVKSWPTEWPMQPVERRWLLIMAGMSGRDSRATELLSPDETIASYDSLIQDIPTKDHSLALLKKTKGADFVIQELSSRLTALHLEANPLTLPLMDQTMELCSKIKHFSIKKIAAKEKEISSLRQSTLNLSHSIASYLDWYEAARLPIRSGLFDDLLATPESTEKKGPIGRAVDAVEQRGW